MSELENKQNELLEQVDSIIQLARNSLVRTTNRAMVTTYFLVGKAIVDTIQQGDSKAKYAQKTIELLSKQLVLKHGKGYSQRNLEQMRKFYLLYQKRIPQNYSAEFVNAQLTLSETQIDLKIGELTHQDIGQMQMYVNYYDRYVKSAEENLTIGIIVCKDKNEAIVEITLPKDNTQIFASQYQLYLPSKEELQALIVGKSLENP